jgi:polar amino acid transport system substrate-binding protein
MGHHWLALLGSLLLAAPAGAGPVLQVGVLDGSPPCSEQRQSGHWQGRAVELWQQLATRENLAYRLSAYGSVGALLEASRDGRIDVGVGCLTVAPDRIGRYRFSLPFQEAGLAVLVQGNRLAAGASLLRALVNPQLLRVLTGYLLAIALLSWLVWRDEHSGDGAGRREQLRRYALVFQVLATGPGTNVIVTRTRGHGVVLLSWLVRIIGASLIVSTITLDVLQQPPAAGGQPRSLDDLAGRRVAVRPGSVSAQLLHEPPLAGQVTIVTLPTVGDAVPLLLSNRADAVLADEQQLRHALAQAQAWQRARLQLALQDTHPESQAFVYSPALPADLALRLDRAIGQAKREGLPR